MKLSDQELRAILDLSPKSRAAVISVTKSGDAPFFLAIGKKHIWRSLQKKGLARTSLGPHGELLTPAGEDLLALMLGDYTIVSEKLKVARA